MDIQVQQTDASLKATGQVCVYHMHERVVQAGHRIPGIVNWHAMSAQQLQALHGNAMQPVHAQDTHARVGHGVP